MKKVEKKTKNNTQI